MAKLYVVGIGPGGLDNLTFNAANVIKKCEVVVGYKFYIELVKEIIVGKKIISTGMKGEIERCKLALLEVENGHDTCIISTGDPGLYGMAGLILELAGDIEVEVIPGVSAAFCAAAELGAPIMHDFCAISPSDLLTPWALIEKRLHAAASADFVIALYNPKSRGRKTQIERAIEIIKMYKNGEAPVGLVKNAGREGNDRKIVTIDSVDFEFIDMMTVVLIGNRKTYIKDGKIITPRGYTL